MIKPLTTFTASILTFPVFLGLAIAAIPKYAAYPEPNALYPEYELLKAKVFIAIGFVYSLVALVGIIKSYKKLSDNKGSKITAVILGVLLFNVIYISSALVAGALIANLDTGLIPQ